MPRACWRTAAGASSPRERADAAAASQLRARTPLPWAQARDPPAATSGLRRHAEPLPLPARPPLPRPGHVRAPRRAGHLASGGPSPATSVARSTGPTRGPEPPPSRGREPPSPATARHVLAGVEEADASLHVASSTSPLLRWRGPCTGCPRWSSGGALPDRRPSPLDGHI
jgi:hypothetical protein